MLFLVCLKTGIRIFVGIASCALLGFSRVQAFTNLGNSTFQSDGSSSDTQAAINAATAGSTILIPAGSFAWSTGVTVNKAVKIQGAGSSSIFGFSTSSVTIGTGSRTFTIQTNGWIVPQVGQVVQVLFTANGSNYMQGTVTSFNGNTLVMNVTSTGGSGTRPIWTFATTADSTIITDNTGSGNAWNITESPGGSIEISGIHDLEGTANGDRMLISGSGKPVLIHDCRFTSGANRSTCIRTMVNCGIVYRCSFDSRFYAGSGAAGNPNPPGNDGIDAGGIIFQNANNTGSWSRVDTMGMRDSGGTNNFYVEDCYFACIYLRAMDISLNSRVVVRGNIFDHSGLTGHGNDTGPYGVRHAEYYNNVFHFVDIGVATVPLDYFIFVRGGTGCIFSNAVDNPSSQEWGQKSVEKLTIEAVDRSDTGNSVPFVSCPNTYPVAHQIGQGFNGTSTFVDPLCVWGNSGTGGGNAPQVYDGAGTFNSSCLSPPPMSIFIQLGRDFIFGSARPGYTPYTYPHPLRAASNGGAGNQPPVAVASANPTNGAPPLTVAFSSVGSSDPEGTALTFSWTFGDGGTSTAANPTHAYTVAGVYAARLSVSDGTNTTMSSAISINVPTLNQPPVAVASASPTNGVAPLTVAFSSAGSSDPEGVALTYSWTFGDGGTSTATNPTHTYTAAGVYGAQLTVSDGTNSTASTILSTTVNSTNAATYYVDSLSGSDSNSGTNPGAPLKNCPGMAAYSGSVNLKPGNTVFFAQGRTWLVTGAQGIYLTGGVTYIGNAWGTGPIAIIRAGGDCDSGVVRFRDDPINETVFRGFEVDANHTISTGVDINHSHWSLMNGATKRVKDCVVHDTWSRTSLGQYKYGIIISNFGGTNGYCDNVEILNTVVHDTSRDGLCLYPGDVDAGCRIKNITVQGCEVYNTGQDPDYGAGAGFIVKGYVQDAWIDHCYAHDTKGAAIFINGNENNHFPGIGPTNINICYSIFTCTNANGAIRIYDGASGKDPKTINIYGNLIYHSAVTGGLYLGTDLGNTNSIRIYNNTFYNAPVYINGLNATFSTLEFKNNVVYNVGGVPLTDAAGQITGHSNNIVFGNGTLVVSGANSYNATNLTSNYELSASSSDPLFKSPSSLPNGFIGNYGVDMRPNNDGLSLQQGSYGVDHGTILNANFSGSINSVTRPAGAEWDIGAYEVMPGSKPAPPTNLRMVSQ